MKTFLNFLLIVIIQFLRHKKYFPFDEQTCVLKFGSWTYDGFKVGPERHNRKKISEENRKKKFAKKRKPLHT